MYLFTGIVHNEQILIESKSKLEKNRRSIKSEQIFRVNLFKI